MEVVTYQLPLSFSPAFVGLSFGFRLELWQTGQTGQLQQEQGEGSDHLDQVIPDLL